MRGLPEEGAPASGSALGEAASNLRVDKSILHRPLPEPSPCESRSRCEEGRDLGRAGRRHTGAGAASHLPVSISGRMPVADQDSFSGFAPPAATGEVVLPFSGLQLSGKEPAWAECTVLSNLVFRASLAEFSVCGGYSGLAMLGQGSHSWKGNKIISLGVISGPRSQRPISPPQMPAFTSLKFQESSACLVSPKALTILSET